MFLFGSNDAALVVKAVNEYVSSTAVSKSLTVEYRRTELQASANSILNEMLGKAPSAKSIVKVSGQFDALSLSGFGTDGKFGITNDGRPTGMSRNTRDALPFAGDTTFMSELGVQLVTPKTNGPRYRCVFVVGTMVGPKSDRSGFGDQTSTFPEKPYVAAPAGVYVQNLSMLTTKQGKKGYFGAEVGRFSARYGPLFLQRPNTSSYFSNERWNNGAYDMDGVRLFANFGNAKLNFMIATPGLAAEKAGMVAAQPMRSSVGAAFSPDSNEPNALPTRPTGLSGATSFDVGSVVGMDLRLSLPGFGNLQSSFLKLGASNFRLHPDTDAGSSNSKAEANSQQIYGVQLNGSVFGIPVRGALAKSDVYRNSVPVITNNNLAAYLEANVKAGPIRGEVGIKQLDAQFGAPGDWGRIGDWWNPVGIAGSYLNVYADVLPSLSLSANVDMLHGTGNGTSTSFIGVVNDRITRYTVQNGLRPSDVLTKVRIGAQIRTNPTSGINLGFDVADTKLDPRTDYGSPPSQRSVGDPVTGSPIAHWYDLSYFHEFGQSSRLTLSLQFSDYDYQGRSGYEAFPTLGIPNAKGGIFALQYSYRF